MESLKQVKMVEPADYHERWQALHKKLNLEADGDPTHVHPTYYLVVCMKVEQMKMTEPAVVA